MIWRRSWDVKTWTWEDNERARECCEVLESCIEKGGIHPNSQKEYQQLIQAREEYQRSKEVFVIIADLEQELFRKK